MVFYRIRPAFGDSFWSAAPSPYPDNVEDIVRGRVAPPDNIVYDIRDGDEPGDVLTLTGVYSRRVSDTLRAAGARGFKTYPVCVRHKNRPIDDFVGIQVVGSGGPVDEARSRLVRRASGAVMRHTGIYLFEEKWDGSDIFCLDGLGVAMFVTQEIAHQLQQIGLRGLELLPNELCNMGRQSV